jgi:hypothetical protein
MSPAEIIAKAKSHGVDVLLSPSGDGLKLLSVGAPPPEIVDLVRASKADIVTCIQQADRWRYIFAEKIATIVKVRGLEPPDAKREAFQQVVIEYANETHSNTDPRLCAWCGRPGLRIPLLPHGVDGRCVWLHDQCHPLWTARRRAEVVAALAKMGIVEPGGRNE